MPEDLEAELARLERIIGTFEAEPDDALRERVFELLESVDAVHRRLVWEVGRRLWEERPELFERLLEDPAAGVLFEMYGLVSPRRAGEERDAAPAAFVGLADLEASIPPPLAWHDAARFDDLADDRLVAADIGGERLVLARTDGEARAYADRCPGTPMPLNVAAVRDGVLLCPWHDCRFDVRTGRRLDRDGAGLEALPALVRDGAVRVGLRARGRTAA